MIEVLTSWSILLNKFDLMKKVEFWPHDPNFNLMQKLKFDLIKFNLMIISRLVLFISENVTTAEAIYL